MFSQPVLKVVCSRPKYCPASVHLHSLIFKRLNVTECMCTCGGPNSKIERPLELFTAFQRMDWSDLT
jgi:hypothetical protein